MACHSQLISKEVDHAHEAGSDGTNACRAVASCDWNPHGSWWVVLDESLLTVGVKWPVELLVHPVLCGTSGVDGPPLATRLGIVQGLRPASVCRRGEGKKHQGLTRLAECVTLTDGVSVAVGVQWRQGHIWCTRGRCSRHCGCLFAWVLAA